MILAHIAGVPVEETLLSFGPAVVAAVSVGLVHIRSLRDRASNTPTEGEDDPSDPRHLDGEPLDRTRLGALAPGDQREPAAR